MGIFDFLTGGKSDDKEKDWYEKESEKAEKQAEKDYQDSHTERTEADYDRSDDSGHALSTDRSSNHRPWPAQSSRSFRSDAVRFHFTLP